MLKVCDDIFLEIDESVIDLTKRFHKPNPKGLEGSLEPVIVLSVSLERN
jgi:hypothetical protein